MFISHIFQVQYLVLEVKQITKYRRTEKADEEFPVGRNFKHSKSN